jgi:hypothetical protein
MISGFCCDVHENCALLCYYAAVGGDSLPMFQVSISVPSAMVKISFTDAGI